MPIKRNRGRRKTRCTYKADRNRRDNRASKRTSKQSNLPTKPSLQITKAGHWQTYSLLGELTSALVLSVSQEFDDTTLIGGKTDNLAGDLTTEGRAAGRLALGTADPGLGGVEGGGFLQDIKDMLVRLSLIFLVSFNREKLHNWRYQSSSIPI